MEKQASKIHLIAYFGIEYVWDLGQVKTPLDLGQISKVKENGQVTTLPVHVVTVAEDYLMLTLRNKPIVGVSLL